MIHQVFLDLMNSAKYGFDLSKANLVVFDECHHTVKNHPYRKIMDHFKNKLNPPRILGLTASLIEKKIGPGQVQEEIKKLECTLRSVCVTASDQQAVEKFGTKPKEVVVCYYGEPLSSVCVYLEDTILGMLREMGDLYSGANEDMLKTIRRTIDECGEIMQTIAVWAVNEVVTITLEFLLRKKSKLSDEYKDEDGEIQLRKLSFLISNLELMREFYTEFISANLLGEETLVLKYTKPKTKLLLNTLLEKGKTRGNQRICSLVLAERRISVCVLKKLIDKINSLDENYNIKADLIMGHGYFNDGTHNDNAPEGMDHEKQRKKILDFKKGKFNVLISTSVAEEGLDIPRCNLVVMFDFPQTFRSYIQSKGRGRAKNAEYIMITNEGESYKLMEQREVYNAVNTEIMRFCRNKHDGPSIDEMNDATSFYEIPVFFTNAGAKLDMSNCIGILHRYCSSLRCDKFTCPSPVFTMDTTEEGLYICTLRLPNGHINEVLKGEPIKTKKKARQAVAQKACIKLHELKGINDNLMPITDDAEEDYGYKDEMVVNSDDEGDEDTIQPLTTFVSEQIYGGTLDLKHLNVHPIEMTFDNILNSTEKKLWDRKKVFLGLICPKKLPFVPEFPAYNDIGQLNIKVQKRLCAS